MYITTPWTCCSCIAGLLLTLVAPTQGLSVSAANEPSPNLPEFDPGALTTIAFIAENDVFYQLGDNQDRNYTGGFGFQFSGSFVRRYKLADPLLALDRLTGIETQLGRKFDRHYYSLLIFGTAFTPDALNIKAPIHDDRPYGSLFGISVRRQSVNGETKNEVWTTELTVAALGLNIARDVQTAIHRNSRKKTGLTTPYDPLGWPNQISNGGEPTASYRVSYERQLAGDPAGLATRKHFQAAGGYEVSAGYYTNVTVLTTARVGWFNSDFWEFSPSAIRPGNQAAGLLQPPENPKWEAFLFGGLRPRFVIYNALLEGQFKHSVVTVTPKRLQAEWDFGAAVTLPSLHLQVVWNAYPGRTSEFYGGQARTHTWGSFTFVINLLK